MRTIDRLKRCVACGGTAVCLFFLAMVPASSTTFNNGDYVTYTEDEWGDALSTAGQLLAQHIGTLYPNGVEIGIPGASGNSIIFSDELAVWDFLPQPFDAFSALSQDLLNPLTSPAGSFGGDILALSLDVDFADAGLLGTASPKFGDLIVNDAYFTNVAARHVLAEANNVLGGGLSVYSFSDLADEVTNLAAAFNSGTVSTWADTVLQVPPANPQPVPEPDSLSLLGVGAAMFMMARTANNRSRRSRTSRKCAGDSQLGRSAGKVEFPRTNVGGSEACHGERRRGTRHCVR